MFPSRTTAAHYLAGLIDGEGSITMRPFITPAGRQAHARDARITNTDPDIIEGAKEALDYLGISYRVYTRTRQAGAFGTKPITDVVVSNRPGLEVILAEVPLRCGYKLAKLQEAVQSYTSYGQLPDRADLERVYRAGGDRHAAKHFGVSAATIFNWRQRLGIESKGAGRSKGRGWSVEERAAREAAAARRRLSGDGSGPGCG